MFTSFKLTNNGKAMHIKSVFGDSIKFTKVAFGSGAKPDDFAQMNELNNVVASVPFVSYDDTTNQNGNLTHQKFLKASNGANTDFMLKIRTEMSFYMHTHMTIHQ